MAFIGNQPALAYTSFAVQHFTTSATTSYTLDYPVANENEIRLVINNVVQQPGSSYAYTASGTSLTLSAATTATDTMYAVFLGKAVQTVNPPNGSVGLSQLSATGTKDSTTFLRGDNTFATAGGLNTPYFEAKISANQTVTTNTAVKAQFDTENFDTNSNYDNTTNYRFTPTTAGKYFCYTHLTVDNGAGNGRSGRIYFYKNGSEYSMSQTNVGSNSYFTYTNLKLSAIINFNGTTDYLEVYGYADQAAGSARFNATAGDGSCYFGAFKIIE